MKTILKRIGALIKHVIMLLCIILINLGTLAIMLPYYLLFGRKKSWELVDKSVKFYDKMIKWAYGRNKT